MSRRQGLSIGIVSFESLGGPQGLKSFLSVLLTASYGTGEAVPCQLRPAKLRPESRGDVLSDVIVDGSARANLVDDNVRFGEPAEWQPMCHQAILRNGPNSNSVHRQAC